MGSGLHRTIIVSSGGVAVTDLDGNGRPGLIVFYIDNPAWEIIGHYWVGHSIDADGCVTGGWTEPVRITGGFGWENQGAGAAVTDLDGDGQSDSIVFHIDDPAGENAGYYRVGGFLDVDGDGLPDLPESWTDPIRISGWFGY